MKYISVQNAIAISNSHPVNVLYDKTEGSSTRIKRDDPDDARICLTCTKKRCTGGRDCFMTQKRKRKEEGGV